MFCIGIIGTMYSEIFISITECIAKDVRSKITAYVPFVCFIRNIGYPIFKNVYLAIGSSFNIH